MTSVSAPVHAPAYDRYAGLAQDLDDLKRRVFARVGPEDVAHVRRLRRVSVALEIVGRTLIHVSPEPVTFTLGVLSLFVHKQLEAAEIGHTALHGAYDKLEGADAFRSKTFRWDTPIDEESWRAGHNMRHHGNTNVAGKDPDIHFGPVRLTEQTPHRKHHAWQLPLTVAVLFPNFTFLMNGHFTGLNEVFWGNQMEADPKHGKTEILPDRSPETIRLAWKKSLRKYVPYYLYNYVLFPALAGPFFWKVLLGNWLAETMRDVYSAATIFCGHVGQDVASYPPGTSTESRGHWYAMQIEAANDFEVSLPVSILCGGLDRQIEHHLFPTLPPQRLREIAPEVRAICNKHGVAYKTGSWGATLKKALAHIGRLSRAGGMRDVLSEMA